MNELTKIMCKLGWQGGTVHQLKREIVTRLNNLYQKYQQREDKGIDEAINQKFLSFDSGQDSQCTVTDAKNRGKRNITIGFYFNRKKRRQSVGKFVTCSKISGCYKSVCNIGMANN